jgi:hypothetical protein
VEAGEKEDLHYLFNVVPRCSQNSSPPGLASPGEGPCHCDADGEAPGIFTGT